MPLATFSRQFAQSSKSDSLAFLHTSWRLIVDVERKGQGSTMPATRLAAALPAHWLAIGRLLFPARLKIRDPPPMPCVTSELSAVFLSSATDVAPAWSG